ncbi:MAG TPA: hypothetical protein VE987_21520, partial [Polyangiaceae bacterium]|nr:hypothetical protein [Polyangiaceae bacterium]
MRRSIGLASLFVIGGLGAAVFACSSRANAPSSGRPADESPAPAATSVGAVGLSLQVAPGVTVNSVAYVLTGPGGFTQSGTIDVSMSATVSALIGGIPAGSGYAIALTGVSADGSVSCSGSSAPFSIAANQTTSVPVALACSGPTPESGTIVVSATTSDCPVIDGIDVDPASVLVGGTIALLAHARGPNSGALTYSWTATAGSLSGATAANPTFTCTSAGAATVTVAVSDGSDAAGCVAVKSATATCTQVLAVSRIRYEGNTFGNAGTYPTIFNDPTISGIQGSVHVDTIPAVAGAARVSAVDLSGISTSFSSKSEG